MNEIAVYASNPYEWKIKQAIRMFTPSKEDLAQEREWGLRKLAWDLLHDAKIVDKYRAEYIARKTGVTVDDVIGLAASAAAAREAFAQLVHQSVEQIVGDLSTPASVQRLLAHEARLEDDGASPAAIARVAAKWGLRVPRQANAEAGETLVVIPAISGEAIARRVAFARSGQRRRPAAKKPNRSAGSVRRPSSTRRSKRA